jgi:protein disulfide-isomerase A1
LAPQYEQAAKTLDGTGIVLAKVDADQDKNKPLAERFGIRGFPTLKIFRNGEFSSDYQGERTAEGIVSYMKKQALPAVSVLDSADAVTEFAEQDRVVIVGFFEKQEGSNYDQFKALADSLRERFLFGAVVGNADVAKHFEVKNDNVILFKKFDEGKNIFTGNFAELEEFIGANSVPLIDEIGPNNYRQYIESGLPLAYLFVDLNVEGQKDTHVDALYDIIKASKGKLNWCYIDWSKYAKHSERLGLSGSVVPALAIEHEGSHWAFDEATKLTADQVKPWIDSYIAGSLPKTIKSEEIPEDNDGPVTVIVAKTFDDVVLNSGKDVLVEFYAPWCGHCKALAPVYEQLGTQFASVDSVVIGKIDATANDVDPKYGVRGFPTLKLFQASGGVVDYQGDRSLADLTKFIKETASTKFELNDSDDAAADSGEDKDEL